MLVRAAGGLLLAGSVALTASQMGRLHPFEAAYANRILGGGLAPAGLLYGIDDRGSASRLAVDWIVRSYARPQRGTPVRIGGGSDPAVIAAYLAQTEQGRCGFAAVAPEADPQLFLASTSRREDERTSGRVVHVVEREGFALLKVFETRPRD